MSLENETEIWYAVRTFNQKEMLISDFLQKKNIPHFIPMIYKEKMTEGKKRERILVPVVHNLLFFRHFAEYAEMRTVLAECTIPMNVMKWADSTEWCPISAREMNEFRLFCDPEYKGTRYVSEEEVEAKVGKSICVITGQFKGMTGKLVRYGNQYFVVKTLAGLGVLLRIPRWYCKVVDDDNTKDAKH